MREGGEEEEGITQPHDVHVRQQHVIAQTQHIQHNLEGEEEEDMVEMRRRESVCVCGGKERAGNVSGKRLG